jgi:hypothetical protein
VLHGFHQGGHSGHGSEAVCRFDPWDKVGAVNRLVQRKGSEERSELFLDTRFFVSTIDFTIPMKKALAKCVFLTGCIAPTVRGIPAQHNVLGFVDTVFWRGLKDRRNSCRTSTLP